MCKNTCKGKAKKAAVLAAFFRGEIPKAKRAYNLDI
jgi:hypothetical protein